MKKLFLIALSILSLSHPAQAMENPAPPAVQQPLIQAEGHLIPSDYTIAVSPNTLFSFVGLVVACLGGGLIYHGAHKVAEPIPAVSQPNLTPAPAADVAQANTQGKWLIGQGVALLIAGTIAIFHKSISGS